MDRATKEIGAGVNCGDGKKHPVSIIIRDSGSSIDGAASATDALINDDGVDLIVAASTADTVCPVADQCEANQIPCITTDAPWESYIGQRSGGDLTKTYTWTYHTSWGFEDVAWTFNDMWGQPPTTGPDNHLALMYVDDAQGTAMRQVCKPAYAAAGYTIFESGNVPPGTDDFTAWISPFKMTGCETVTGLLSPPDFFTFWTQAIEQGWWMKVASFSKCLVFPQNLQTLGAIAEGLTTEVWWAPSFPFRSPLTGETCQKFAAEFTRSKRQQWTQALSHFSVFEMAVDALERATSVDDKAAILTAVKTTKLDTIAGTVDFTELAGNGMPPFPEGPRHIVENCYKTPLVGGQWRQQKKSRFDLTIVSNPLHLDLKPPAQTLQQLPYSYY
jgi:branched-chain amino acid transport system substrate-binding protein